MRRVSLGPAVGVGGLGAALLAYRREQSLTQAQLGELLGFHQSYVSLLERGRRQIRDGHTLERVEQQIGWPVGTAAPNLAEGCGNWSVDLGWSVVRLSDAARTSGQPLLAVRELWPLVRHLHTGGDRWHGEVGTARLAFAATLSLATALGHVVTQERLGLVVSWSERALVLAEQLDDDRLRTQALRTKGNELRKAGHVREAIQALRRAAALAFDPSDRGTAAVLLARSAAEAGDAWQFHEALLDSHRLLDTGQFTSVFHPYGLGEIQLRGLVRLPRLSEARELLRPDEVVGGPWVTPQWRVLRLITVGHAALALHEIDQMADLLGAALRMAERQHLSRQIQRIVRIVALAPSSSTRTRLRDESLAALARLQEFTVLPAGTA